MMRPSLEITSLHNQQPPYNTDFSYREPNYEEIPSTSTMDIIRRDPWQVMPSNYPYQPPPSGQFAVSTYEYPQDDQVKQEQSFPVGMFIQPIRPMNRTVDNRSSDGDSYYPPSFSNRASTIYINPSILLPHQRASYPGPGTPMPVLPPSAYPYPYWNHSSTAKSTKTSPKKAKKAEREPKSSKKGLKIKICLDNKPAKVDDKKLIRRNDGYKKSRREIESRRKCRDARDWLNERAAKERAAKGHISKSSRRTVNRATSPINFDKVAAGDGSGKKRRYRDVALSPIRCIEPVNRG